MGLCWGKKGERSGASNAGRTNPPFPFWYGLRPKASESLFEMSFETKRGIPPLFYLKSEYVYWNESFAEL